MCMWNQRKCIGHFYLLSTIIQDIKHGIDLFNNDVIRENEYKRYKSCEQLTNEQCMYDKSWRETAFHCVFPRMTSLLKGSVGEYFFHVSVIARCFYSVFLIKGFFVLGSKSSTPLPSHEKWKRSKQTNTNEEIIGKDWIRKLLSEVGFEPTPTRVDCGLIPLDHPDVTQVKCVTMYINILWSPNNRPFAGPVHVTYPPLDLRPGTFCSITI